MVSSKKAHNSIKPIRTPKTMQKVAGGLAERREHFSAKIRHVYETQTYDDSRREQNKWRKEKEAVNRASRLARNELREQML